jgi:hypothetical protein
MANSNFKFNVFVEKEKLKNNGSNFTNWFCNLRIILASGQKAYVLEEALGDPRAVKAKTEVMSTHAFVLVDSVGPPSAEVCRAAASFP